MTVNEHQKIMDDANANSVGWHESLSNAPDPLGRTFRLSSEAPATPEEEAEEPPFNASVALQEIAALRDSLQRAERLRASAAESRDEWCRTVDRVKGNVAGWFRDQVDTGEMTRAKANEALEAMGLQDMRIEGKYVVTVRTGNGSLLGTRTVDAADEDAAVEVVNDDMEVDGYVRKVRWTINLGDDEEIERFEGYESWEEWQVSDSDVDQFISSLEISAEEE